MAVIFRGKRYPVDPLNRYFESPIVRARKILSWWFPPTLTPPIVEHLSPNLCLIREMTWGDRVLLGWIYERTLTYTYIQFNRRIQEKLRKDDVIKQRLKITKNTTFAECMTICIVLAESYSKFLSRTSYVTFNFNF